MNFVHINDGLVELWLNPRRVLAVEWEAPHRTTVVLNSGHTRSVELPAATVVAALMEASSMKVPGIVALPRK
jgi:hypothetical protein